MIRDENITWGRNMKLFDTNVCCSTKTNRNAMRDAQSEGMTPSMCLQILWDRGQQWVLQWTRNSGQHSRRLLNNLPIFPSITGCEYCFTFDSPSRHNVHTMAPHVRTTRDGFSQREPNSYHHGNSTSHFYLALTSWYGVVSWFLSGISFMTSYKINSLMVAWKLICMFGWRHYRTFEIIRSIFLKCGLYQFKLILHCCCRQMLP